MISAVSFHYKLPPSNYSMYSYISRVLRAGRVNVDHLVKTNGGSRNFIHLPQITELDGGRARPETRSSHVATQPKTASHKHSTSHPT